MTPEEIRAEAVRRIAAAEYRNDCGLQTAWDDVSDYDRANYLGFAARQVAALGDLLPTRVETKELEDGYTSTSWNWETGEAKFDGKPNTRMRRYVTEWRLTPNS